MREKGGIREKKRQEERIREERTKKGEEIARRHVQYVVHKYHGHTSLWRGRPT